MIMLIDLSTHRDYGSLNTITKLYAIILKGNFNIEQLTNFSSNVIGSKTLINNSIELLIFCGLIHHDYTNILKPNHAIIDNENIKKHFIRKLLNSLLESEIEFITMNNVEFVNNKVLVWKYSVHYKYYALRNLLISENILINHDSNRFEINHSYLTLFESLSRSTNKSKTLEQLKKEIENKEMLGEKAEKYVLEYESMKFPNKNIIYVAPFNVSAGYDIISYQTSESKHEDKFIEVKCYSGQMHFYWSKNEINVAKDKGINYSLYLVNSTLSHKPIEIKDPYKNIFCNNQYKGEIQSIKYTIGNT